MRCNNEFLVCTLKRLKKFFSGIFGAFLPTVNRKGFSKKAEKGAAGGDKKETKKGSWLQWKYGYDKTKREIMINAKVILSNL